MVTLRDDCTRVGTLLGYIEDGTGAGRYQNCKTPSTKSLLFMVISRFRLHLEHARQLEEFNAVTAVLVHAGVEQYIWVELTKNALDQRYFVENFVRDLSANWQNKLGEFTNPDPFIKSTVPPVTGPAVTWTLKMLTCKK